MRPHAGTAAFLEALQAAMPAGRDRTPAPTMFFARLSVDDVTDDLDATAPPETSAGVLNLGTGARRVGLSNALAAGASAKRVRRRGMFSFLVTRTCPARTARVDEALQRCCRMNVSERNARQLTSGTRHGDLSAAETAVLVRYRPLGNKKSHAAELVQNPSHATGFVSWESLAGLASN